MDNDLIAKLSQKIDVLTNLEQRCTKGILPDDECMKSVSQITIDISDTLPADSAVFHMQKKFVRDTMWWSRSKNGYAGDGDLKNIMKVKSHIEALIHELQPSFINSKLDEEQFYFSNGQKFEARKKVFELMKRASKNLAIIDGYLDESIFDYINSLENTIDIKLLTGAKKPIFPKLFTPFKENRPNTEARECVDCHDRFLIIDNNEIWQLGGSINRIGESGTMINKVEAMSGQYKKLSTDFEIWWKKGTQI
jgi:hypothetical protein